MYSGEDFYAEFITRKRWPLNQAAWLVNGVFLHTSESFGTFMEQWYSKNQQEKFKEEKDNPESKNKKSFRMDTSFLKND